MLVEQTPNVGSDSFLPPTTRSRSGAFFEGESALSWDGPACRGLFEEDVFLTGQDKTFDPAVADWLAEVIGRLDLAIEVGELDLGGFLADSGQGVFVCGDEHLVSPVVNHSLQPPVTRLG